MRIAGHDNPEQPYDFCISAGPTLILATYESRDMETIYEPCPMYETWADIPLFAGFFSVPLAQIWEDRKVPAPPEDSSHFASILEVAPSGLDACTTHPSANDMHN
jgi:hypothetical protein